MGIAIVSIHLLEAMVYNDDFGSLDATHGADVRSLEALTDANAAEEVSTRSRHLVAFRHPIWQK